MKAGRNTVTKISTRRQDAEATAAAGNMLNVFNMQQRSRVKRSAWSPRCFDFIHVQKLQSLSP